MTLVTIIFQCDIGDKYKDRSGCHSRPQTIGEREYSSMNTETLRNLRPSFGVLWVLSLMENLGLGDKPSGRLRRIHGAPCNPGWNYKVRVRPMPGGSETFKVKTTFKNKSSLTIFQRCELVSSLHYRPLVCIAV